MKILKITAVSLLLFTITTTAIAGKVPQTKEYSKEFSITPNTKLRVDNRFGQVNIQNWNNPSISIYVLVKVDNGNAERTQELLKSIEVTLTQEDDLISAITKIDEDYIHKPRRLFQSTYNEISIDYTIKMPAYVDVSVINRFGDIFINELNGHLEVELKYGNLRINQLRRGDKEPLCHINLSYGNATIDEANWLKIDLRYGKIEVDELTASVILSRYSKIAIARSSSLVINSKYDKFELGEVNNITGESGYTTFIIDVLNKKFSLDAKYGDVKIANVSKNFEKIYFNGSYAGLTAGIPQDASYLLNARVSYGKVNLGDQPNKINRIESNTSIELNGAVGKNDNPRSRVNLNMRYGNAVLTH